ncbi:MAG: PorT family protein [Sphingobacteriales bacterium]|nr:PorT family protein [Sphingobacteriales bacterium]
MKKVLLFLFAFALIMQTESFAQKTKSKSKTKTAKTKAPKDKKPRFDAEPRIGLSAGLSFANLSRTIGGLDKDGDYRIGVAGGMLVNVPFGKTKRFAFQPSVDYVQKGAAEVALTPVNRAYTALRYAELPLNFVYNLKWGKNVLYFGGGPFIDFDLPSKKVSKIPGNKIESDVSFGDQVADDMNGIDFGGNAIIGFRTSMGFFVSLHYTQGARNLIPVENSNNDRIKSIAFGIRIGYLFKAAKK